MDATSIAMCDLEDRASEMGFSEQALRQLMKEAFLLEMGQMGEAMLSGKMMPLGIDQQD
jgi:hypothetical protein